MSRKSKEKLIARAVQGLAVANGKIEPSYAWAFQEARKLLEAGDMRSSDEIAMDIEKKVKGNAMKPKKPLSTKWNAEDRLRAVMAFLPDMQTDIYAGKYSEPGRPNITSLQHIAFDPLEVLEAERPRIEEAVAKNEENCSDGPFPWETKR